MRLLTATLLWTMVSVVPVSTMSTTVPTTTSGQSPSTTEPAITTTAATTTTLTTDSGPTENTTMANMTTVPTTQAPMTTTTEKTFTITKTELNTVIIVSTSVLFVLVALAAVCGCCCMMSRRRHRRRHRYGVDYKHNDDELSYTNKEFYQPEVDHSAIGRDVFIPYNGEPIATRVVEPSPASKPYGMVSTVTSYSPYLYDDRDGQYKRGSFDRPYRSNLDVLPKRGGDRSWILSAPNLTHELPRAWI